MRELEDVLGAEGDVVEEEDGDVLGGREEGGGVEERGEGEVAQGGEAGDAVCGGGVEGRGGEVVADAEGREVRG